MAGRKVNHKATLEALRTQLSLGIEITVNPKHSDWIISGLQNAGILLNIRKEGERWKIKSKPHIEESKVEVKLEGWEIRSYCNSHGIYIYPRPLNKLEYEIVIERNGLLDTDSKHYLQQPKPGGENWVKRVSELYKLEYLKITTV